MFIIISGDISSHCLKVILFNHENYVFLESVPFWPPLLITLQILRRRWSRMAIGKKSSVKTIKNRNDNLHNSQQRFALHWQFAKLAKKDLYWQFQKKTKSNNLPIQSGTTICKKWPGTTICKIDKMIWNENDYLNVIWRSSYQ